MSNVTGLGDKMHPVDIINDLPIADIVEIAVVYKTKDGRVSGKWSSQTNEELGFKAVCLTKWAMDNIT
jgi:hypothetical protein